VKAYYSSKNGSNISKIKNDPLIIDKSSAKRNIYISKHAVLILF